MAQIAGVNVTDRDAWWIVDWLRAVGRAEDATAASAIEQAIKSGVGVDDLTSAEKNAIMRALAKAPWRLKELRDVLAGGLQGGGATD